MNNHRVIKCNFFWRFDTELTDAFGCWVGHQGCEDQRLLADARFTL